MNRVIRPIEVRFLDTILKVSIGGMIFVLMADYFTTGFEMTLSTVIDLLIFASLSIALVLYTREFFRTSIILVLSVIVSTMFFQSVVSANTTNVSMSVVLVTGFSISLLLRGAVRWAMHAVTAAGMATVFFFQMQAPEYYKRMDASDVTTYAITYFILYFIISYCTAILKTNYDESLTDLAQKNDELVEKSNEIETQNEELVQSRENLSELNLHLENLVKERTEKIIEQNKVLINYSYSNAHHVRGPVARILGLINLTKMDPHINHPFFFEKIEEQALEIDHVVKKINDDLEIKNLPPQS